MVPLNYLEAVYLDKIIYQLADWKAILRYFPGHPVGDLKDAYKKRVFDSGPKAIEKSGSPEKLEESDDTASPERIKDTPQMQEVGQVLPGESSRKKTKSLTKGIPSRKKTKSLTKGVPWTHEENELLVQGLREYGRRWTRIAAKYVTTKTPTQVRDHARRYDIEPTSKPEVGNLKVLDKKMAPLNRAEEAYLDKIIYVDTDWKAILKYFPDATVEDLKLAYRKRTFDSGVESNLTILELRFGIRWTNKQHRMATKYQRMEAGNYMVRCKKKTRSPAHVATDDMLQEIFLRLPDGGSVIRSSTVCKRWHSLLHNYPSFDNFVSRFVQHHAHKQEPYSNATYVSALFRFSISMPFYELNFTTSHPRTYDLNFMPSPKYLIIRASCGDLLLLTLNFWQFLICNPVTRQWFILPDIPDSLFDQLPDSCFGVFCQYHGYALVRHSPVDYSVVIVSNSQTNNIGECQFHLILFKSTTGEWTQTPISLQYEVHNTLFSFKRFSEGTQLVHTREGVVHWLEGTTKQIFVVAAFDPVSFETRLIMLPWKVGYPYNYTESRVQLGVVRGRLRLFLTERRECRFCVQIFELDDGRWTLAHNLTLIMKDAATNTLFSVLYLDPYDGNVIYLVRGNRISRYEIGQTEDVGICEFPWEAKSIDELRELVTRRVEVLPLLHPPWPTQISSLAASTTILSD